MSLNLKFYSMTFFNLTFVVIFLNICLKKHLVEWQTLWTSMRLLPGLGLQCLHYAILSEKK